MSSCKFSRSPSLNPNYPNTSLLQHAILACIQKQQRHHQSRGFQVTENCLRNSAYDGRTAMRSMGLSRCGIAFAAIADSALLKLGNLGEAAAVLAYCICYEALVPHFCTILQNSPYHK